VDDALARLASGVRALRVLLLLSKTKDEASEELAVAVGAAEVQRPEVGEERLVRQLLVDHKAKLENIVNIDVQPSFTRFRELGQVTTLKCNFSNFQV